MIIFSSTEPLESNSSTSTTKPARVRYSNSPGLVRAKNGFLTPFGMTRRAAPSFRAFYCARRRVARKKQTPVHLNGLVS